MAALGPIGIRIRSGQRQSIPSSSCPDLIRAPPQPPESERITGSSPAMTTGRDGVSGETILRPHLILMPMGLGPATPRIARLDQGKVVGDGVRPGHDQGRNTAGLSPLLPRQVARTCRAMTIAKWHQLDAFIVAPKQNTIPPSVVTPARKPLPMSRLSLPQTQTAGVVTPEANLAEVSRTPKAATIAPTTPSAARKYNPL
jgi:hypothetical protein